MSLTKVSYSMIEGATFSVADYGAVGDSVTDDTAAIQAAFDAAAPTGGTVYFPEGIYRTTSTVKIGKSAINNYATIVYRGVPADDPLIAAQQNTSNITFNEANYFPISLLSGGEVVIAADFTAEYANPKPVVEYNIQWGPGAVQISGSFTITTTDNIVNGKYVPPSLLTTTYPTNNLIGLAISQPTNMRLVSNILFASLSIGLASIANYWTKFDNLAARVCGNAFNFALGNAIRVTNVEMATCSQGLVFDGGASYIGSFHSEQVRNDLVVFGADCCTFESAYLEDVGSPSGSGQYAVRLGADSITGTPLVVHSNFVGLRVGSVSTSKKAFRIKNTSSCVFSNCREYTHLVDADATSNAILIQTDFTDTIQLPPDRFMRLAGGFAIGSVGRFIDELQIGTETTGGAGGFTVVPSTTGAAAITTHNKTDVSTQSASQYKINGSLIGQIAYDVSAVTYATTSDYRLKNNVQPMTGALERVAALKPVTFNWKINNKPSEGFIAHELAEVIPSAVLGEKDAVDEEGKPIYQSIDTSFMVVVLTKAIQELTEKIKKLENLLASQAFENPPS